MNTQEFLAEARKLRQDADAADGKLMLFLYEGEKSPQIWSDTGMTFVEFIEGAHICKATRYLAWKRTRETLGEKGIAGVGVEAVIAAGGLKSSAEQTEVIQRAKQFEKINETSISEQTAARYAGDAKIRALPSSHRTKSYSELLRENEVLKEKLRAAEQTIALLRSERKKKSRSNLKKSAA